MYKGRCCTSFKLKTMACFFNRECKGSVGKSLFWPYFRRCESRVIACFRRTCSQRGVPCWLWLEWWDPLSKTTGYSQASCYYWELYIQTLQNAEVDRQRCMLNKYYYCNSTTIVLLPNNPSTFSNQAWLFFGGEVSANSHLYEIWSQSVNVYWWHFAILVLH